MGKDPKLNYTGFSCVYDPMGNEIVSVENKVRLIVSEIHKSEVKDVRSKLPFLDDMNLI